MGRRWLRRSLITVFVCLVVATIVAFASGQFPALRTAKPAKTDTQPQAVPVHVATVSRGAFPVALSGLGTVQAWNQVVVRSRVDGQLQRVAFEEGQSVKEGDVLVELDRRPFQAALDQASAKIVQDQANLTSAAADLERTKSLSSNGFATKQLLDQQTANVAQLNALIKADQAAETNARVSLDYTTIRAPISGSLGLRLVDVGNIVHAADANGIVTIAQVQPIAVSFTAPESQLPAIRDGMKKTPLKVSALTPDGTAVLSNGELEAINNTVDVASGTIQLKGKFDNLDNKLWPGMSVATRLVVNTLQNVVFVPDLAVQRGPNGPYVYVVKAEGTFEKRDVKLGPEQDSKAVVYAGLDTGDQVVTTGHYRVQPGAKAEVIRDSNLAGSQGRVAAE